MNKRTSFALREKLVGLMVIGVTAFHLTFARAETVHVVDGDTLVLGDNTIRMEGIDAPELAQTCKDPSGNTYRCGHVSKAFLEKLASSTPVTCKGSELDAYDRRIATCFAGSINLNQKMVENGQAYAFRQYSEKYIAEETEARMARRGLWSGTAQLPWEYRAKKWQVADQTAPADCPIKGNITSRGRIYHTPWSPHYSRTRINERAGERWFCSEIEALAAGWRPPSG
ncbi:MAG: thermonuclease family protein [Roseibium sp.]